MNILRSATRYLVVTFLVITFDPYNFETSGSMQIKAESLVYKMSAVWLLFAP